MISSVAKTFSAYEEYPVSTDTSILLATKKNVIETTDKLALWKQDVEKDYLLAEKALLSETNTATLLSLAQSLDSHANFATKNGELNIKIKSLKFKEELLKKIVAINAL